MTPPAADDRGTPGLVRRVLFGSARALIVITGVAGTASGLYACWRWRDSHGPLMLALAVGALLMGAVISLWITRSREPHSHRAFLLLLVVTLVTRVLYVSAADQPLFSDAQRAWDYARSVAEHGYRRPDASTSSTALTETRALPILVPIAVLSNGNALGYKLASVLAVVLCMALVYWLALLLAGRKAALLSAWLVAIAPEPLLAAVTPSEDIFGTVFALLALTLLLRLQRDCATPSTRWRRLLVASALLGVCVFLADLQRNLGPFLLASTVVAVALSAVESGRWATTVRLTLSCVVLPAALLRAGDTLVTKRVAGPGVGRAVARATWEWMAIYGNSERLGETRFRSLLSPLSDNELRTFAIARTMSDLVDAPRARALAYVTKTAALYHVGDQYWYYLPDTTWGRRWNPTPFLSSRASWRWGQFMRAYSDVFRPAFLLVGLLVLLDFALVSGNRPDLFAPLLFTGFMTLLLCEFGNVQSRYLFPFWFILPLYIGRFVSEHRIAPVAQLAALRRRGAETLLAFALASLALVCVVVVWRAEGIAWTGRLVKADAFSRAGQVTPRGRYELVLAPSPDVGAGISFDPAIAQGRANSLELIASADSGAANRCRTQLELMVGGEVSVRQEIASTSTPVLLRVDDIRRPGGHALISLRAQAAEGQAPCSVTASFPWLRSR